MRRHLGAAAQILGFHHEGHEAHEGKIKPRSAAATRPVGRASARRTPALHGIGRLKPALQVGARPTGKSVVSSFLLILCDLCGEPLV